MNDFRAETSLGWAHNIWAPGYDDDQQDPYNIGLDLPSTPRRKIDTPIRPDLMLPDDGILVELGLSNLATKPRELEALSMIIANCMSRGILRDGGNVHYSRNANHYSEPHILHYQPKSYSRTFVLRMIDKLSDARWIFNEVESANPLNWFRSRFRPTPQLIEKLANIRARPVRKRRRLLVMKNAEKELVPIEYNSFVAELRKDIAEQNEVIGSYKITLATGRLSAQTLYDFQLEYPIHEFDERFYRVFNIDYDRNGRWYGPLWQRLPKEVRRCILINGCVTAEPDIRTCHPRLICAKTSMSLPFDDPDFDFYKELALSLPSPVERPQFKTVFNIGLCVDSRQSALKAIAYHARKFPVAHPYDWAKRCLREILERYPRFEPYLFCGYGLRLQNIDAEICTKVQRSCRQAGIPCLSIHDGFCTPAEYQDKVLEFMEAEMELACRQLRMS